MQKKIKKTLANILSFFIFDKYFRRAWRFGVRHNCLGQVINNYKSIRKYKNYNDFKYFLTLTATMKNEADYVCEWLEYYLLMGVEHFYLYDNESTDDIEEKLKPYIEQGLVTYINYPGVSKQLEIYNHAVENFRLETKWMIIADLDEFILFKKKSFKDLLNENDNYNQLVTRWYIFGNSGHIQKPEGLVIENYLNRADDVGDRKSIVKPLRTYVINSPHRSSSIPKTLYLDIEDVQCNHYFGKSEEEYRKKKSARADNYGIVKYNMDCYNSHNKNDVYDDSMLQYVESVKQNLKKRIV